jgi:hypothetical protein
MGKNDLKQKEKKNKHNKEKTINNDKKRGN